MIEQQKIQTTIIKEELWTKETRLFWKNKPLLAEKKYSIIQENDWFQYPSENKYKTIIKALKRRFASYPILWDTLNIWEDKMSEQDATHVCHIHLSLTDALYRRFGTYIQNQDDANIFVSRQRAEQYISTITQGRWKENTLKKITQNIINIYIDIGRLKKVDKEDLSIHPISISTEVTEYLFYVLLELGYENKDIFSNHYWNSFGISSEDLHLKHPNLITEIKEKQLIHLAINDWAVAKFNNSQ